MRVQPFVYEQRPISRKCAHRSNPPYPSTPLFSSRWRSFWCCFLTTHAKHGNVPPMIESDKTKTHHRSNTGRQSARLLSQNETPVSSTHRLTGQINSDNFPGITSLHVAHAQLPWIHILTQNPAGGRSQTSKIFRQCAANDLQRASTLRMHFLFADHETRITEHETRFMERAL